MKMELIEGSETSAIINQTPGNYPKGNLLEYFLTLHKDLCTFMIIWRSFLLSVKNVSCTRVGTLIFATIYLQLIQNRYMFRSFTVLQCSHQHCVQPVASDVEVVGYL